MASIKNRATTLGNVPAAAVGYALAEAALGRKGVTVAVVETDRVAAQLALDVGVFAPSVAVHVFPAWDVTAYSRTSPSVSVMAARQATLSALQSPPTSPCLVITTPAALATKILPATGDDITLKVGSDTPRDALMGTLVTLGYARQSAVTDKAEFAVRGSIIDIFPPTSDAPLRLEFFDETLESIRAFQPLTQRTLKDRAALTHLTLTVGSALSLTEERISLFREQWREAFQNTQAELYQQVSAGVLPDAAAHYLPLFSRVPLVSLLDVVPDAPLYITPNAQDAAKLFHENVQEAYQFRASDLSENNSKKPDNSAYYPLPPDDLYLTADAYAAALNSHTQTLLSPFAQEKGKDNKPYVAHMLPSSPLKAGKEAAGQLMQAAKNGQKIILSATHQTALLRLNKTMQDAISDFPQTIEVTDWQGALQQKASLLISPLVHGFTDTARGVTILTDQDVYGEKIGTLRVSQKKKSKASDALKIAHFSELSLGDFVVHEEHGVGRFDALVTLETPTDGGKPLVQDFLKLTYAEDARLFVPVESLDVLSRFKAGDIHGESEEGIAGGVKLDRLGSTSWQTRKARIKVDLLAMAKHLMSTAAAREIHATAPHPAPDVLFEEFCAAFPYRLTVDQARTIEEVITDLTAPKPMDRLVVGDVGFGKTEVAVRAAFVAAAGGRQAAITVPTTLLARQHGDVFKARFNGFPFNVATLSRMVAPAAAKKIKADLAAGKIDIIVGTHALLSDSIQFKDLGLLVIDEEQRFGVKHKEKLKTLKETVDVLTLTATPIPRTLHMGLSGLKTLSTITTPPVDRLATHTLISPWDGKTIRENIMRELYRGGQVYVVTPLVRDIKKLQEKIKDLVPEAKIATAHGQMTPTELEDVMAAFYDNQFNVLIATTIVESGLDVKNANTLLVHRADRFGLSQLYQLRGRVGRGAQQGYATFFLPETQITPDGMKRLQVLQKLTGLGSGFLIANYDMDIRGFGNLVGKQQSGNIREIGAELYGKLLKEAVDSLKRKAMRKLQPGQVADAPVATEAAFTPSLNLGLSYRLPAEYIPEDTERLTLYRRLANIESNADLEEVKADIIDRYGALPESADHLLCVLTVRNTCKQLNIEKLDAGPKGITVHFYQKTFAHPMNLLKLIQTNPGIVTMHGADQSVTFHFPSRKANERLEKITKVLTKLADISKD